MKLLLSDHLDELGTARAGDPAVIDPGETATWGELLRAANQVANHLRALVPARSRVALLADRSAGAYAAILGIWRAGCVYVPVDCGQPEERIRRILAAAGVRAALVAGERAALSPQVAQAVPGIALIALESRLAPGVCPVDAARPDPSSPPPLAIDEDLAYVFFTSGSTGEPKGVMVAHRSLFLYGQFVVEQAELRASDRLLGHTPLHFDVSLYPLAGALASGAALVTVPRELEGNARAIHDIARRERLSVWISAPYLLTLFLGVPLADADLPELRVVSYVGEVLPNPTLIAWMRRFPGVAFHNLYGPTEATVTCTGHRFRAVPAADDPIPIGKPHPGVAVVLLDEQGAAIEEAGKVGEIHVHGACVARGYLGQPELTRRAFVDLGERSAFRPAYATGDLAYYDAAGDLVFVGRRDLQVKIRGYRVELGEIEAALGRAPGVRAAAVVAIAAGSQQELVLVGFVEPGEGGDCREAPLRGHVARELPRYMVPHRIVARPALPRGAAGKVDRKQLRAEAREVLGQRE